MALRKCSYSGQGPGGHSDRIRVWTACTRWCKSRSGSSITDMSPWSKSSTCCSREHLSSGLRMPLLDDSAVTSDDFAPAGRLSPRSQPPPLCEGPRIKARALGRGLMALFERMLALGTLSNEEKTRGSRWKKRRHLCRFGHTFRNSKGEQERHQR